MGNERVGDFLFVSAHFGRFVAILFAAFIAPDRETNIEGRQRHYRVSFAQWDSMAAKEIPSDMKPMIFAQHHPAIIAVFPHTKLPPSHRFVWAGN
jgi:hypothetical protein